MARGSRVSWVLSPSGPDRNAVVMLLASYGMGALSEELLALLAGETYSISADHPARKHLERTGVQSMGATARDPVVWVERTVFDAIVVHVQPDGGFRQSNSEAFHVEEIFVPDSLDWFYEGADRIEYRCEGNLGFIAAVAQRLELHGQRGDEWGYSLAPSLIASGKWKLQEYQHRYHSEETVTEEAVGALAQRAASYPFGAATAAIDGKGAEVDFEALARARKALLG